MREVGTIFDDPRVQWADSTKLAHRPGFRRFLRLVDLVKDYCEVPLTNEYGTVEALIVNSHRVNPLTVILGLRLLNVTENSLPYDALEDIAA
jgi:hypothetical protein